MILYMSYPSRFIRLFGEMFSKYFCTHSLKHMIKRNSIEMKCIPMKRFEIIGISDYYFQIFNISYVVSGKMFREILSYEQQYHQRNGNNELNELLLYKRPN